MLKNIYNQKITILNKLKQADSQTKLDIWHKTILEDAAWYTKSERNVSGNTVLIGTYITVLIPFHDTFKEYSEWKKTGEQDGFYTMSAGDYIILGEVTEDVDASNVVKLMSSYEPNVCKVSHCEIAHNRFGAKVQLYIEGV